MRKKKREIKDLDRFFEKNVFFVRKKIYKNKTLEPIIQCCDFRAIDSIKTSATEKQDFNMIGLLSQDLIGIEVHYHKSCYCKYTVLKRKYSEKNVILMK